MSVAQSPQIAYQMPADEGKGAIQPAAEWEERDTCQNKQIAQSSVLDAASKAPESKVIVRNYKYSQDSGRRSCTDADAQIRQEMSPSSGKAKIQRRHGHPRVTAPRFQFVPFDRRALDGFH